MIALSPEVAERDNTKAVPEVKQMVTDYISHASRRCWKASALPFDRWDDSTQDVFVRLLQTIPLEQWPRIRIHGTDEYFELWRAIGAIKQRVRRSHRYVSLSHDPEHLIDPAEPLHADTTQEWEEIGVVAGQHVDGLRHRVLDLIHWGLEPTEIADALHIPVNAVYTLRHNCVRALRKWVERRHSA